MIGLVLLFLLGCYINPSLSDYYNNINAIQKPDDPHHTTMDMFELTHNLFQNLNAYTGLINLESVPRMFTTNVVQSLSSSSTVIHVITLISAQASFSVPRASFTTTSLYFSSSSTRSAGTWPPSPGAPSEEAMSPGTPRSETRSTMGFSAQTLPQQTWLLALALWVPIINKTKTNGRLVVYHYCWQVLTASVLWGLIIAFGRGDSIGRR